MARCAWDERLYRRGVGGDAMLAYATRSRPTAATPLHPIACRPQLCSRSAPRRPQEVWRSEKRDASFRRGGERRHDSTERRSRGGRTRRRPAAASCGCFALAPSRKLRFVPTKTATVHVQCGTVRSQYRRHPGGTFRADLAPPTWCRLAACENVPPGLSEDIHRPGARAENHTSRHRLRGAPF